MDWAKATTKSRWDKNIEVLVFDATYTRGLGIHFIARLQLNIHCIVQTQDLANDTESTDVWSKNDVRMKTSEVLFNMKMLSYQSSKSQDCFIFTIVFPMSGDMVFILKQGPFSNARNYDLSIFSLCSKQIYSRRHFITFYEFMTNNLNLSIFVWNRSHGI